jgi:hypothetical protein
MPLKFGALLAVISWTALLGACVPSLEKTTSSQEAVKPINEIVEPNDEEQSTDDQEVFLLEQQTPEGEVVEFGNTESSGLSEAPEEFPKN